MVHRGQQEQIEIQHYNHTQLHFVDNHPCYLRNYRLYRDHRRGRHKVSMDCHLQLHNFCLGHRKVCTALHLHLGMMMIFLGATMYKILSKVESGRFKGSMFGSHIKTNLKVRSFSKNDQIVTFMTVQCFPNQR